MPGLVVFGITGRMGQSLVRALREAQGAEAALSLCGAVASPASSRLGQDAALEGASTGVVITADPGARLKGAAALVPFPSPAALSATAPRRPPARGPPPAATPCARSPPPAPPP